MTAALSVVPSIEHKEVSLPVEAQQEIMAALTKARKVKADADAGVASLIATMALAHGIKGDFRYDPATGTLRSGIPVSEPELVEAD